MMTFERDQQILSDTEEDMRQQAEGTCEHSEICGRDALKNETKCILHLEDPDKSKDAFDLALDKHLEKQGADFEKMVFPTGRKFSGETFESLSIGDAVFYGPLKFLECTFEGSIYAPRATLKGEFVVNGCEVEGWSLFRDAVFEGVADFRVSKLVQPDFNYATFEERAEFIETDFSGYDFALATFEDRAEFKGATFRHGGTQFDRTEFEGNAWFTDATFEDFAFFSAEFSGEALFGGSKFKEGASFQGTEFSQKASFYRAVFEESVSFEDSRFEGNAGFVEATFQEGGDFTDTDICRADFSQAKFNGDTVFYGAFEPTGKSSFEHACFDEAQVQGSLLIVGKGQARRPFETGSASFQSVNQGAGATLRFRHADLSRCRFRNTNLLNPEFVGVKWYDEAGQEGWVSGEWFDRVGLYDEIAARNNEPSPESRVQEQEDVSWPEIERLYRQLKKNYEERGDFPRAGDFHIGEKEARRRNEKRWGPWFLLTAYRYLSIYGERPLPAFIWIVALIVGCALGYVLMDASTGAMTLSSIRVDWIQALVLSGEATMFPVRTAGFEETGPQALNLVQRVFSPILIALLALALRQRVKR